MQMIKFERVKKIVAEHAPTIVEGHGWSGWAKLEVMKTLGYIAGAPAMGHRQAVQTISDELRKVIQQADVRCIGDLLELVPRGRDNRLPGWLYDGVTAEMDEDGEWVLVPKSLLAEGGMA